MLGVALHLSWHVRGAVTFLLIGLSHSAKEQNQSVNSGGSHMCGMYGVLHTRGGSPLSVACHRHYQTERSAHTANIWFTVYLIATSIGIASAVSCAFLSIAI